jgi:pyruvate,orthophosphate dikinase
MTRYVYDFDEPSDGGKQLLGGKGIGLAEMTQLGVPVPAGFTITTDACRAYLREGGLPEGLEDEIAEHIARLEERAGKRFGDPEDPLLVSVRSGAAISMPAASRARSGRPRAWRTARTRSPTGRSSTR